MRWTIFLGSLFFTLVTLLPGLFNPHLIIGRNNDLNEFFWPVYYFTKEHFLNYKTLPLWNNLILSGYPLVADPQAPLFYLPNILFLFLPLELAFLLSIVLHILVGGIGIYFCSRKIFKFSNVISLFTAFLYISTPRLIGYIEAGHFGLIFSFAWIPYVLLFTYKLSQNPSIKWIILFSLALSNIFFTHTITFLIIALSSLLFYLILLLLSFKKISKTKSIGSLVIGYLTLFGLISVSLLPQIEWSTQTTRFLLFNKPEVYPKWHSYGEFLSSASNPILFNASFETEKWIAIGIIPIILAFLGLGKLKTKYKIICGFALVTISLISSNNLLPFYEFLLKQPWFVLLRVTTRVWIIFILFVIFLAGFYLERVKLKRIFKFLIISLSIIELVILSWIKISQPIQPPRKFVPNEVYSLLSRDKERFRVFCTTGCLSQNKTAAFNIETIEGYNTLQQLNYYKHSWELTKSYWNYYSLYLPPLGITTFEKIQPSSKSLGEYNVKYIISTHSLIDNGFELVNQYENFKIYINKNFKPRVYPRAVISFYSPNYIKVNVTGVEGQLILADVYNKGWKAYTNQKKEIKILEAPSALRAVNVPRDTKFIEFKFQPSSFDTGAKISLGTMMLIVLLFLIKKYATKN